MVGTMAMRRPCISEIRSMIRMNPDWSDGVMEYRNSVPTTPSFQHSITPFSFKRMLLGRKFLFPNVFDKALHSSRHNSFKIGIAFNEFRREVVEQTEHVVNYQHLAIAI